MSLVISGCDASLKLSGGGSSNPPSTTPPVLKSWHFPTSQTDNVSPDNEGAYYSQTAMNSEGNIILVWMQRDPGGNYQIFKSESVNGVWTHPTSLTDNISPDGQAAWYPRVAMNDSGDAIITWSQSDGLERQIFKSERRNGIWSHPVNLADNISPSGGNAYDARVAMDSSGNAIIAWEQQNILTYQIYRSEYRSGTWVHPLNLAAKINAGATSAGDPDVAMDNNGNAIIVWDQDDGTTEYQIFKSEYRNGSWTDPSSLVDNISPDGQDANDATVDMAANGNAIITWSQDDSTHIQIFMSNYRNGAWTHPASLADNISPNGQNANSPDAAIDSSGNTLIAWVQSNGTDSQIYKSEYRSNAWTHPSTLADHISPAGSTVVYLPYVGMNKIGSKAVIVWDQLDGSEGRILMSEYKNGAWIHPTSVAADSISPTATEAYIDQTNVSINDDGNVILSWWQQDGTVDQTFIAEFK